MRRIAIITGSRADACPLRNVIRLLGDNCIHIKTQGLYGHEAFIKESLEREKPDFIVLLGDRFETLVAAGVAALLAIPIVHLHGGETTEGAVDDQFRNAISKLAYYHFVCHSNYRERLVGVLGEARERIFVTGAPAMDALLDEPLTREECEKELGRKLKHFSLACYHPTTLEWENIDTLNFNHVANLCSLSGNFIIAGANCDIRGKEINDQWQKIAKNSYYPTLNHRLWLSLMHYADSLIGNSSSFIFEGMTLGKKVFMVGDRQKGRYEDAVEFFKTEKYPYGIPGEVSPKIVDLLMTLPIPYPVRKAA